MEMGGEICNRGPSLFGAKEQFHTRKTILMHRDYLSFLYIRLID